MQKLVATLEKAKTKLAANAFPNEAAVSLGIIQPVLAGLGWDTADPEQVCPEYSFPDGGGRADFALLVKGKLNIIIEAKAVGNADNAAPQLFQYAYQAGALLAVLTDGREWRIYLTFVPGGEKERLVHSLNITERDPQKAAQNLARYLAFDEVKAGRATENAKQDLEKQSNRQESKQAIPQAWKELIDKENSPIVESLLNETASNCGYPPDQKDVRDFLHNLNSSPSFSPTAQPNRQPATGLPSKTIRTRSSRGPINYTLYGQEYEAHSAAEAYTNIIRELAVHDNSLLDRLEPVFNGLARRKEDISTVASIQPRIKEIFPGWWLNTNLSNQDKLKQLRKVCQVAGIRFGADLKIEFPSA